MEKVKVLIVEDEFIIAESIAEMVEELGYEVTGIFSRAKSALISVIDNPPDIALVDIKLKGEESGIWLGQQLRDVHQIPFIYLTSYGDKKTVESAGRTLPDGYLLKPVEKQNIYVNIETALIKVSGAGESNDEFEEANLADQKVFSLKDAIFIKDGTVLRKIYASNLLFVKANGNYLELYTPQKKYMIKSSLKSFIEHIPGFSFFQTHRSYLVNMALIESIGHNYVTIAKQEIPLVREHKDDLIQQLRNFDQ